MSKKIDIQKEMIDNPIRIYRSRFKLELNRALDLFCYGNYTIDDLEASIEPMLERYVSDESYRKENYKPLTIDCRLAKV